MAGTRVVESDPGPRRWKVKGFVPGPELGPNQVVWIWDDHEAVVDAHRAEVNRQEDGRVEARFFDRDGGLVAYFGPPAKVFCVVEQLPGRVMSSTELVESIQAEVKAGWEAPRQLGDSNEVAYAWTARRIYSALFEDGPSIQVDHP